MYVDKKNNFLINLSFVFLLFTIVAKQEENFTTYHNELNPVQETFIECVYNSQSIKAPLRIHSQNPDNLSRRIATKRHKAAIKIPLNDLPKNDIFIVIKNPDILLPSMQILTINHKFNIVHQSEDDDTSVLFLDL